MQPELALVYSSNAGNGIAGVGWGVAGVSEIGRCGSRVARDGASRAVQMDGNDHLCIDGERLVLISGTALSVGAIYHTERESFAQIKVTAVDGRGPSAFEVRTRDGAILTYGGDAEGVLDAAPRQVTGEGTDGPLPFVRAGWLLRRRADRSGNWMSYEYERLATSSSDEISEPLLTSIEYTGLHSMAPNRRVAFVYEVRPDPQVQWRGSVQRKLTRRLARIATYAPPAPFSGQELVRTYELAYTPSAQSQRSLLASVRVCDRAGVCLPASSFAYSGANPTHAQHTAGIVDVVDPESGGLLTGDVNGDGMDDLVYRGPSDRWYVRFGSAGTLGGPIEQPALQGVTGATLADYDGDGDLDITFAKMGGDGVYAWVYALTWDTGSPTFSRVLTGPIPAGDGGDIELRAFGGHGRNKVAVRWGDWTLRYGDDSWQHLSRSPAYLQLGRTGIGHTELAAARTADLDGDGQTELLQEHDSNGDGQKYYDGIHVRGLGASTAAEVIPTNLLAHPCRLFADINGDGLADVVQVDAGLQVQINRGKGIFGPVTYGVNPADFTGLDHCATYNGPNSPVTAGPDVGVRVIDYNRDGRDDLLLLGRQTGSSSNAVRVLVSRGESFVMHTISGASLVPAWSGNSAAGSLSFDIDGDGVSEFLQVHPTTKELTIHRLTALRADLLVRVTDEHTGVEREVVYGPGMANHSSNAICNGELIYPMSCATRGPTVVLEERTNDGVGGIVTARTHSYRDPRVDHEGEGWLGYSKHETVEAATGHRTTHRLSRVGPQVATGPGRYPFLGIYDVDRDTGPAYPRIATTTSFVPAVQRPYGGATYLAVASGSSEVTSELTGEYSGTMLQIASTTSIHDAFGNETRREIDRGQGLYREVIEREFSNDTSSNWLVGLATREQVTSTAPGGTATRVTTHQYDPVTGHLVLSVRQPDGGASQRLQTQLDYEHGLLRRTIQSGGGTSRVTLFGYDADAIFVTQTEKVFGGSSGGLHVSRATWHQGTGAMATATDPNGLVTSNDVDGFGRVRKLTRADGTWTAHSFSLAASAPYLATRPDGTQIAHIVPPASARLLVTTTGSDGSRSAVGHDHRGRPIWNESDNAQGTTTYSMTAYDRADRVVQVTGPFTPGVVYPIRHEYDAVGRHVAKRRLHGSQVLEWSSYSGRVVDRYVENGDVDVRTQTETDLGGAVIATRAYPAGPSGAPATTQFQHGPFGVLRRVTNPAGNVATMTHDALGRQIAIDDPNLGQAFATYDAFGQVASATDARGITATMAYDTWGRLSSRSAPDGTDTWTWDSAAGAGIGALASSRRVDTASGYQVTRTLAYDGLGRPSESRQVVVDAGGTHDTEFEYGYDAQGRLARIDYPVVAGMPQRFAIAREYGPRGHLQTVRDANTGAAVWAATTRDLEGRVTRASHGNGLVTDRVFDPVTGLLTSTRTNANGGEHHLAYGYSPSGDVTSMTDHRQGRTEVYTYDGMDRLVATWREPAGMSPGLAASRTYDAIGNITSSSATAGCTREYGTGGVRPNALRRVVCPGATHNFSYDPAGNVLQRGDLTMSWTSFGKPIAMANPSGTIAFAYDAEHRRIRKQARDIVGTPPHSTASGLWDTTTYHDLYEHRVSSLHDTDDHVFVVRADNGPVAQYRWNASGGGWSHLHTDRLGTVQRVTNDAGLPVEWADVDAFGHARDPNWSSSSPPSPMPSVRFGYTGHRAGELGPIDMGGRQYDPQFEQFLSADPLVQSPRSGASWNRYSYVFNNPLRYTDPSGYTSISVQAVEARPPPVQFVTFDHLYSREQGLAGRNFNSVFAQLSNFTPGVDTWIGPTQGNAAAIAAQMTTGAVRGAAKAVPLAWLVSRTVVAGGSFTPAPEITTILTSLNVETAFAMQLATAAGAIAVAHNNVAHSAANATSAANGAALLTDFVQAYLKWKNSHVDPPSLFEYAKADFYGVCATGAWLGATLTTGWVGGVASFAGVWQAADHQGSLIDREIAADRAASTFEQDLATAWQRYITR